MRASAWLIWQFAQQNTRNVCRGLKKCSIRWIHIVQHANDHRWKWGNQHTGGLCSKVVLHWCSSRGFVLLSGAVTTCNYVEITSGLYFTSLQWRLSLCFSFLLEITIQCHFPARAAQRPVSGAFGMENYQLALMKWPLERPLQTDRPLPLSTSRFHTTTHLIVFSPSALLKLSVKCIFTTEDFCTVSAFCSVKRWITVSALWV